LGLAKSDGDGNFVFKGIPSGKYRLSAEARGFAPAARALNFPAVESSDDLQFQTKGGDHRVYVDIAPQFVANAALTLAGSRCALAGSSPLR
jgi:hypothetical protein